METTKAISETVINWNEIILAFIALIGTTVPSYFAYKTNKRNKENAERAIQAESRVSELEVRLKEGSKVIYHPLFRRLKEMKRDIEMNMGLKFDTVNPAKSILFSEILIVKLTIWYEELYKLAEQIDMCIEDCKDCGMFLIYNQRAFDTALERFDKFPYDSKYTEEDRLTLLKTLPKFNIWHDARVRSMISRIEEVSNDDFMYLTDRAKIVAIFDSYTHAFGETLSQTKDDIKRINGDLKGLKFKGRVIEADKH